MERTLILMLSLTGFFSQVTWMSIHYFSYTTTTQVLLVLQEKIYPHSIALCVRFGDILDRERLLTETGIAFGNMSDLHEALAEETKLTVKQIFEYTPKSSEVIEGCFYRPDNMNIRTGNRKDCEPLFNISRYFTMEFMCYRIQPLMTANLFTESVTTSHFKAFTIYELQMTERFRNVGLVMPISFVGVFPYLSRRFAEVALTKKHSGDRSDYNWFHISPSDYRSFRLESPYDTMCVNRPAVQFHICRKECQVERLKDFNRAPISEILIERLDMQPLSYGDLSDPVMFAKVTEIISTCRRECDFTACESPFTKTRFQARLFKNFSLAIASMTPTEPDIHTVSQARMDFVEFFSFVCSCFGTWFGISFFSLGRVKRIMKVLPLPRKRTRNRSNRKLNHWHPAIPYWTRVSHQLPAI